MRIKVGESIITILDALIKMRTLI